MLLKDVLAVCDGFHPFWINSDGFSDYYTSPHDVPPEDRQRQVTYITLNASKELVIEL